jgi:hypothetical protein
MVSATQLNCKTEYKIRIFNYRIRFYFIVTEHTYHVEEHPCQKILKGSQISPLPALEIRNNMLEQNVLDKKCNDRRKVQVQIPLSCDQISKHKYL